MSNTRRYRNFKSSLFKLHREHSVRRSVYTAHSEAIKSNFHSLNSAVFFMVKISNRLFKPVYSNAVNCMYFNYAYFCGLFYSH